MVDAINEECNVNGSENAHFSSCTVNTNDGYIDLWMDDCGNIEVIITHDNESEGECPILCKAIEDGLPDWSETVEQWEEDNQYEDERTSHGFRDEADYITGDTYRFLCF